MHLDSNMVKLRIATMTDKMLAWTKFEQWAAVAKMVPTTKNTLIRTSFEELKTSICWLKPIIQVVNYRKKMRRSQISCESQTFWVSQNLCELQTVCEEKLTLYDQRHTDIAKNNSEENNSWLSAIRIAARDCSDENFNNEGLLWWEL